MKKRDQQRPDETQDTEIEYVSRTEMKHYMESLQELGKRITELRPDQQAQIPMQERLREAVSEMARIHSNNAKKRHLQFIGKLMRNEDEEQIRTALERFDSAAQAHTQRFHHLEHLREGLLSQNPECFKQVIDEYPECDLQHLRALVRNALKERDQNKPPVSFRKLFKYLRELDEQG